MSKYNLSCTIQNIVTTYSNIWTLKFFFSFRGQNKTKNAAQNITGKSQHRQQQGKVLK